MNDSSVVAQVPFLSLHYMLHFSIHLTINIVLEMNVSGQIVELLVYRCTSHKGHFICCKKLNTKSPLYMLRESDPELLSMFFSILIKFNLKL